MVAREGGANVLSTDICGVALSFVRSSYHPTGFMLHFGNLHMQAGPLLFDSLAYVGRFSSVLSR